MIKKFQKVGNSKGLIIPQNVIDLWEKKFGTEISTFRIELNEDLKLVIYPFIEKVG